MIIFKSLTYNIEPKRERHIQYNYENLTENISEGVYFVETEREMSH